MTGAERTPPPAEPGPDANIDDIQADIQHTREQLGATIEALSDKVNVVERTRVKARAAAPSLVIAASVAGITVIALVWWRRRARPG